LASKPVRHIGEFLAAIRRMIGAMISASSVLVLPLSLLLFLQWPLREWVQAYSREANDLAQSLFALYVSLAIVYATRRRSHLAVDAWAQRYSPATRAWLARVGALGVLLPWSVFIMATGWSMVSQSIIGLERFPDTFNPGYFFIKGCSWLLALLVCLQAAVDVLLGATTEES
jgi:TRAP-type mannitol/chloroaromatic compound transport system permease small subunit